jgi:small subunit ribosomal protein S17
MMAEQARRRGVRQTRRGVVVSRSGDKSVVVRAERRLRHPLYGKVIRRLRKFHAHDERNEARPGDIVEIVESRPLSRTKRWRVTAVLSRAPTAEGAPRK